MTTILRGIYQRIDWVLFFALIPIVVAGLVTMDSFVGDKGLFDKQIISIAVSLVTFFTLSFFDFRFLRKTNVIIAIFLFGAGVLMALFGLGSIAKGAKSWFDFGGFSFQPADFMKIVVILVLAKYFSRRHVEIAHFRHIIVSGIYAFIPFVLVMVQPDFGSAMIIFFIWFGMILVSGVSKKHLFAILIAGAMAFALLWVAVFAPYQKARILTFIHPLSDIRGAGYNAYQSTIAVGSGQILGKGLGYGTQSRLNFLPEYETDFIFSAFAEEWGFIGVLLLFALYGVIIWRILENAMLGESNFETLFCLGFSIFIMSHLIINIGMNIGLLPVTGITVPFMSYGGSHLLAEFTGLGIIMGMRRYQRAAHRDIVKNEFLGI